MSEKMKETDEDIEIKEAFTGKIISNVLQLHSAKSIFNRRENHRKHIFVSSACGMRDFD